MCLCYVFTNIQHVSLKEFHPVKWRECPSLITTKLVFVDKKPRSCFCVPKLRISKYEHLWPDYCHDAYHQEPIDTNNGHTYLQISCHMQSRQIPEICGFKTTPKTSTKTKLQVTSYKWNLLNVPNLPNLLNLVISHKLQVTNKDKEIQSLASLFLLLPGAEYFRTSKKLCWRKFVYNIFLLLCCIHLDTRVCLPLMLPTGCV